MISLSELEGFQKKFDVVSVFIDHEGDTLLLHRQDHKPQGNTWAMVAGKVDASESLEAAIAREVEEEVGLRFLPNEFRYFQQYFVRYPEFDYAYHVFHLPLKERLQLQVNQEEHKDHLWIRPSEALSLNLIQDEDFCIKHFYQIT